MRRARIKVPARDAEDVAGDALAGAFKAAFQGGSVGEFVSMLNTILDRRIADYHRKRERSPDETALPEEHGDDDEVWGDGAVSPDFTSGVGAQDVVNRLVDGISDAHRAVVEAYVFEGLSAKETAAAVNMSMEGKLSTPMTEANVHQIAKRFRTDLRQALDGSSG